MIAFRPTTAARPRSRARALLLLLVQVLVGLLGLVAPTAAAQSEPRKDGPPPRGKLEMFGDIGDFVPGVIDDPVHDPTLFEHPACTTSSRPASSTRTTPAGSSRGDPPARSRVHGSRSARYPFRSGPSPTGSITCGRHTWREGGGTYYLYYAASSFGTTTPRSGSRRTRTPGDLDSWEDLGPVLTSNPRELQRDRSDGLQGQGAGGLPSARSGTESSYSALEDMTTPVGRIYSLARHPDNPPNPIENPQIFRQGRVLLPARVLGLLLSRNGRARTRPSSVARPP